MNTIELNGQIAVVIGAAQGIGFAIWPVSWESSFITASVFDLSGGRATH